MRAPNEGTLTMNNVRHTITGPIGDPMEPYDDGIEAIVTSEPCGEVELRQDGHEFIASFVLDENFNFYDASDPENDGIFGALRIIGLNRYSLIERCQVLHHAALATLVVTAS